MIKSLLVNLDVSILYTGKHTRHKIIIVNPITVFHLATSIKNVSAHCTSQIMHVVSVERNHKHYNKSHILQSVPIYMEIVIPTKNNKTNKIKNKPRLFNRIFEKLFKLSKYRLFGIYYSQKFYSC